MNVIHLNYSDINGGAARAAYRIHHALRGADIDSQMFVNEFLSGDWTAQGPSSKSAKALGRLSPLLVKPLQAMLRTENPTLHSPAVMPST